MCKWLHIRITERNNDNHGVIVMNSLPCCNFQTWRISINPAVQSKGCPTFDLFSSTWWLSAQKMTSAQSFYVRDVKNKLFPFKLLMKTWVILSQHFIRLAKAKDADGSFAARSLKFKITMSGRGLQTGSVALGRLPFIIADPSVPFRSSQLLPPPLNLFDMDGCESGSRRWSSPQLLSPL